MKKTIEMKDLVMNAMIGCVYVVLTLAIVPLAYGGIQMRFSEIMVFLAFYNRKYIPGLIIGCFVANIPSPMGMMDMIFGTLSTILVCFAMYKLKNIFMAAVAGGIITGLIVGSELYLVLGLPFVINAFQVFLGEVIVLLIGAIIFKVLEKNENVMNKYIYERKS